MNFCFGLALGFAIVDMLLNGFKIMHLTTAIVVLCGMRYLSSLIDKRISEAVDVAMMV